MSEQPRIRPRSENLTTQLSDWIAEQCKAPAVGTEQVVNVLMGNLALMVMFLGRDRGSVDFEEMTDSVIDTLEGNIDRLRASGLVDEE